jgi:predicted GNAT family acetyltransferase
MASHPSSPPPLTVHHNPAASRFEVTVEGRLAVADYVLTGQRMALTHTFVPPELRGRGVAEALVRAALADARTRQLRVDPQCSYVARFIERHAEYQDLLA